MKRDHLVSEIAVERMKTLISLAKDRAKKRNPESTKLAKRYVKIAKGISTHYKIKMPRGLRNSICGRCGNILIPGINCTVRLASSNKYVVYRCECGREKHIFYG